MVSRQQKHGDDDDDDNDEVESSRRGKIRDRLADILLGTQIFKNVKRNRQRIRGTDQGSGRTRP